MRFAPVPTRGRSLNVLRGPVPVEGRSRGRRRTARSTRLIQSHMPSPILVFDGECGFCHRSVRFILAHERRGDLCFVPRDSALGRSLREQFKLPCVESLLWIESGQAFVEWDAVAHVAAYVGGFYARLAAVAGLLPRSLLNCGYRLFARLRKRLGRRPRQCLQLTPAQQQRFLG